MPDQYLVMAHTALDSFPLRLFAYDEFSDAVNWARDVNRHDVQTAAAIFGFDAMGDWTVSVVGFAAGRSYQIRRISKVTVEAN
jgi:hypothetical protein